MEQRAVSSAETDLEVLRAGIRLMALRALHDPEAADEVAQETLVRASLSLRELPRDKLGAYVAGIARHVIADIGRARQRVVSLGQVSEESLAAPAPDPLEALCAATELRRVRDALGRLSPEDRELLRLSFFNGLSPTEIAAQTGAPAERIRQRKHRALARLRQAFDAIEGGRHGATLPPTISEGSARSAEPPERSP